MFFYIISFIHQSIISFVSLTKQDSHADDEGKQRARVAGLANDLSVGGREHGNDQQESAQDLAAEGIADLGPPDKKKHNILFTAVAAVPTFMYCLCASSNESSLCTR